MRMGPVAAENPVIARLKHRIRHNGPISVAEFMQTALGDADGGYYTTRDPFGAAGDFTTSPEISQVFGELIGLWCADTWQKMGAPAAFALIELGPGRGTLMADALRALHMVPACRAAASLHLVETSPVLREIQQTTLRGENIIWHSELPIWAVPRQSSLPMSFSMPCPCSNSSSSKANGANVSSLSMTPMTGFASAFTGATNCLPGM